MTKTFTLQDLDCPHCAAKIEQAVGKLDAVNRASVNFITQRMVIDIDDKHFDTVIQKVIKVCHKIEPDCKIIV